MSDSPLFTSFDGEPFDPSHIPFDPVPRLRARRRGWSAERQTAFIFALSRCGSVARAAHAVGMNKRSAYQLLDAPGADDFARAWDAALDEGVERVRSDAMKRALGGAFVPVFRRGKIVRVEHRHCDRLALALLSGKDQSIDGYRRLAVDRRAHRRDMRELDEARAAARAAQENISTVAQTILDRLEAELAARPEPVEPRITWL